MSIKTDVKSILNDVDGVLLKGSKESKITSFSTDSRYLEEGALFIALVAERDGHSFIPVAVEKGASALLVSDEKYNYPDGVAVILVKDTLFALGEIAKAFIEKKHPKVIGITGSNGKTSTKEMLASILDQVAPTLRNEGNFNNLIGLPWTIFRLEEHHEYAVLEMGMNAFGEIARLAEIAKPQIGLITSVAPAHLEGLGSIEGVAKAKGELFQALSDDGVAIINADDPHIFAQSKLISSRKFYFSSMLPPSKNIPQDADFIALSSLNPLQEQGFRFVVQPSHAETFEVILPLVGRHQVSNALGAIATALVLGIPKSAIVQGLAHVKPEGRRLRLLTSSKGIHLLDDCYNSNPTSCLAALKTLQELSQNNDSIAVLGDMLELGKNEKQAHEEIGRFVATSGVNTLFAFGKLSKYIAKGASQATQKPQTIIHSLNINEIKEKLTPLLKKNSWILVKASRGMKLERISQLIETL